MVVTGGGGDGDRDVSARASGLAGLAGPVQGEDDGAGPGWGLVGMSAKEPG